MEFREEILPRHMFKPRWVPASALGEFAEKVANEALRCAKASGWNPKIIRLKRNLVCIDFCLSGDDLYSAHIALNQDHPVLAKLPPHTPRAVKSIYRKEVRMAHIRADEYWPIHDALNAADAAWKKFRKASHD